MTTASLTCDICEVKFDCSDVLDAHKTGHKQADQWLYEFYVEKIKPTENDRRLSTKLKV